MESTKVFHLVFHFHSVSLRSFSFSFRFLISRFSFIFYVTMSPIAFSWPLPSVCIPHEPIIIWFAFGKSKRSKRRFFCLFTLNYFKLTQLISGHPQIKDFNSALPTQHHTFYIVDSIEIKLYTCVQILQSIHESGVCWSSLLGLKIPLRLLIKLIKNN